MAAKSRLSPWKGGGFGMFSTIESPYSRILRITIVTPDRKIQVQVPDQYRKQSVQIRAKPVQSRLNELAEALFHNVWAAYEILPAQENYIRLHKQHFPGSTVSIDTASHYSLHFANQLFSEMQWVYMLKKGDSTNHPLPVKKVVVECFQMKFNRKKGKLVLQLIARAEK